ncbi:MAG: NIL domain-containing protein [Candidatus Omnitrophota bacterium]
MGKMNIELFIPGEMKDEPIICQIIKSFDIEMKIVEASFSTESGWAYLTINGRKGEIKKLFDFLTKKGINVEVK